MPQNPTITYERLLPGSRSWLWLFAGALLSRGLFWTGSRQAAAALAAFGPTAASAAGRPWYGAGLLVLCAAGLLYLLIQKDAASATLEIAPQGLRLQFPGKPVHDIPWAEIEGLAFGQEVYRWWFSSGRLRGRARLWAGKDRMPFGQRPSLSLDQYVADEDLPQAVQQLKEHLYPQLAGQMSARFRAGETLDCGALRFNRQVLNIQNKALPWNQIEQIDVKEGTLFVKTRSQKLLHSPVSKIFNLEILLSLAALAVESTSEA